MANEFAVNIQDFVAAAKQMGLEIYTSAGTPTASGPKTGALCVDTTNGALYINTGTAASATWNNVQSIAASEITLAEGSILVGNSSGVSTALNAKTSGQILVGNGTTVVSVAVSGDATLAASGALSTAKVAGAPKQTQAAPTAKTVSSTMTAADILAGIVTVNQAAGATSAQQLPTAADLDTALPTATTNDAFDFSVINTSTVDAEDASVTTNTGWTLVGSMDIHAYSAAGSLDSSARFRARKTGAGAWTLYRIA